MQETIFVTLINGNFYVNKNLGYVIYLDVTEITIVNGYF